MKNRYFLEVAYKGSNYHGWQIQSNAHSVQETLQDCLSKQLGEKIVAVAAGRTDAGVHACQQYVHIDATPELESGDFLHRINSFLPEDIVVKAVKKTAAKAHARYSAYKRSYQYKIHKIKNPFLTEFSYYYPYNLNVDLMNDACRELLGEQVFKSFSKVKTYVKNFICDISEAEWRQSGDEFVFNISANRFLRGMVRAIVGTLLEVGTEEISIEDFRRIKESMDRRMAGRAVPACGLYLTAVAYPDEIFMDSKK